MDREGKAQDHGVRSPINVGDAIRLALPALRPGIGISSASPESTSPREARALSVSQERDTSALHRSDREFYSELSTNRYPFASLWSKDTGKSGSIVVRNKISGGATENRFEWIVQSGDPVKTQLGEDVGGLPGPFDRKVFRALERIVLGRTIRKGLPLTNPQEIHAKEILDLLRLTDQGYNFRQIGRSLARLASITIHCSGLAGPARPKEGQRPKSGVAQGLSFHLIDMIRWAGTIDPKDGLIVPQTRIFFGEAYVERVNAFEVRPLDWDLWMTLEERPLSQRLFEILEMKFFGLEKSPYVSFHYTDLCQLLPTRPQRKGQAMQVLEKAHDALRQVDVVREGGKKERWHILDRVEWNWDGDDAVLRYFPDRGYLRQLQSRRSPEFDPRAIELAQEFHDMDSLAFYQLVVRNVDWSYVSAARTEVRQNRRVGIPGRYFTATLEKILRAIGQPVPWGSSKAN